MDRTRRGILPPLQEKRSYVQRMFTAIAPHYDQMNRLMALGRDRTWRRTVVRYCALPAGGRLLDVATGTGDIAYEAMLKSPSVRAVGIDLTREMMVRGLGKHEGTAVPFAQADGLAMPFPDNTFDAVCSGFMMRNVLDVKAAFAEQVRVVKPGGRVVCLEITMPATPVFRQLFHLYFFRVVPWIGGLISHQREAYTYLPESVVNFPRPPQLSELMKAVGLRDVRFQTAMMGTVAVHWGTK